MQFRITAISLQFLLENAIVQPGMWGGSKDHSSEGGEAN